MQTQIVGIFLNPIFFVLKLMMINTLFAKHFCKHRRKKSFLFLMMMMIIYLFNNNVLLKFIHRLT